MSIPVLFQRRKRMIYRNIIWMITTMMSRLQASSFSVLISVDSVVNTLPFLYTAATSFNIKGLTYYKNNEEDPYITLKDVCMPFPFPLIFFYIRPTFFQGRRR